MLQVQVPGCLGVRAAGGCQLAELCPRNVPGRIQPVPKVSTLTRGWSGRRGLCLWEVEGRAGAHPSFVQIRNRVRMARRGWNFVSRPAWWSGGCQGEGVEGTLPCPGGSFPKPARALHTGSKRSFPFTEGGTREIYHRLGNPRP